MFGGGGSKEKVLCMDDFFCILHIIFLIIKAVESSSLSFYKGGQILFVEYIICIVLIEYLIQ